MAPPDNTTTGTHNHDHTDHAHGHLTTTTTVKATGDQRVPVTILTGFLGAGKTTLLNYILQDPSHGYKFAIIENELGDVGIDDTLLTTNNKELVEEEIIEVVNGCICCTVRGDLMEALQKLHKRFVAGVEGSGGKPFDSVIIETTGLADPAPVVQTFFIEPNIQRKYRLDAVLTVVDASQIMTRLDEEKPANVANEALQQILFADKILLNKVDLMADAPEELDAVKQRIQKLHPTATIIPCQQGRVPPKELLGLDAFDLDRICTLVPDFLEDEFLEFNEKHDSAVGSVAFEIEGELQANLFNGFIEDLVSQMRDNLYRYKGVLAMKGHNRKYIFQGVGMLCNGDFAKDLTWKEGETRANRLVIIGKHLKKDLLEKSVSNCLAPTKLRFDVGQAVQAYVGFWIPGTVINHWDEGNPYRVKLNNGNEVWASMDTDDLIRPMPVSKKAPPRRNRIRGRS